MDADAVTNAVARRAFDAELAEHQQRAVAVLMCLEQDVTWIDADGDEHDLLTMNSRHRLNVLRWLRARAAVLAELHGAGLLALGNPFHTDMAMDAWERLVFGEWDAQDEDPDEWLESTPLVRRLAALCHEPAGTGPKFERGLRCPYCTGVSFSASLSEVDDVPVVAVTRARKILVEHSWERAGRGFARELVCRGCRRAMPIPEGYRVEVALPLA